jgi:hypothetical protein
VVEDQVVAGAVAEAVEVVPVAVGKDFSGKRKEIIYLFHLLNF